MTLDIGAKGRGSPIFLGTPIMNGGFAELSWGGAGREGVGRDSDDTDIFLLFFFSFSRFSPIKISLSDVCL